VNVSVFEVFKVGVGPSSSHTMGPMLAARFFVRDLEARGLLDATAEVYVQLYGSLALTGLGHCTDRAILLGLEGHDPAGLDPAVMEPTLTRIRASGRLQLGGMREIAFDEPMNVLFHRDQMLPGHSNGMRFTARDAAGKTILAEEMYSIGGGAVQRAGDEAGSAAAPAEVPLPFGSGEELLAKAGRAGLTIAGLTRVNEEALRPAPEVDARLDRIWAVMQACVQRGFAAEGVLPGVLKLKRRAPQLKRALEADAGRADAMEWVNAWALAVNEENAAGGQVVTAPTNGAAGIVPAVMHYYAKLCAASDTAGIHRLLLTAGAIGLLYKRNASISGAEMGCQGEVGVACSMAAARLERAGRERRRDRHGAQPRAHLRPDRGPRADSLHRAECHGGGQGDQRCAAGASRRRHSQGLARPGDCHHAPDRLRHEGHLQGNLAGRTRRQRPGVLNHKRGQTPLKQRCLSPLVVRRSSRPQGASPTQGVRIARLGLA
jgi:L-serine dehydratase